MSNVQTYNTQSFLNITEVYLPGGWRSEVHAHPGNEEMLIVMEGQIEVRLDRTFTCSAGSVLAYPRSVAHTECTTAESPVRLIGINWLQPQIDQTQFPNVGYDYTGRIRSAARWMLEIASHKSEGQSQALDGLLSAILIEYLNPPACPEDERITCVKKFIEEHIADPITLEDLARIACMSKFHFARVFLRTIGRPPIQYLREVRVNAAKWLLLTTKLSISDIAVSVGFPNEFQFCRVFRRVTGSAPSTIRKHGGLSGRAVDEGIGPGNQ